MSVKKFNYSNTEITQKGGLKTIRKVSIENGVGYKSISKFKNNKRKSTVKKELTDGQVMMIKNKQFIPGLFNDCVGDKCTSKKKSKKKVT